MSTLAETIHSIADASGAEMGISILHIESGETVDIRSDQLFPMASVLKIPVLCEAFRQMAAGKFALEDRWEVTLPEKNVGSGILTYMQDGLTPTVRDLLTVMIIISDNTATDMLINRLGVESINSFMHELGLTDIHMVMNLRSLFDDMIGEEGSDPRRLFRDLDQKRTAPDVNRDGRALSCSADNNTSTPKAMTQLVAKIFQGEVVSRAACDDMLHILLQQQLNARLPAYLPYGVPFAHKTGTLSGFRNDSGVLYAGETDHIAVTVFSKWDAEAVNGDKFAELERTQTIDNSIGRIGHALYEQYRA